jgi:hypothetical protein
MSPNEFQLRTALRSGEGDHVDADAVIARARDTLQVRHERRVRFGSVAAVVAVVGGIGVTGGIVLNGGSSHDNTSSSGGGGQFDTAQSNRGGGKAAGNPPVVPAASGPLRAAAAVRCPATAPQPTITGAGDRLRAGGPLFPEPVESIKICAYQQQSGVPIPRADGTPQNTVLTGQQATALAASLDAAPKQRTSQICPHYLNADAKTLVIIGLSRSGDAMAPVTATVAQNPCNVLVTNGTAIRYDWSPPGSLAAFLATLPNTGVTGGPIHPAPSGKVTGSPIQS